MNLEELREYLSQYTEKEKENIILKNSDPDFNYALSTPYFKDDGVRKNRYNPPSWGNFHCQRHSRYEAHTYHPHTSFVEIMFMYIGHCVNNIESKQIRLDEGDIFIMSPNVWHLPVVDDDSVLFNFCVSIPFFYDMVKKFGEDTPLGEFLCGTHKSSCAKWAYIKNTAPEVYEAGARTLMAFTDNDWEFAKTEQEQYLDLFITTLMKYHSCDSVISEESILPDDPIPVIMNLIDNSYKTISLDELSNRLNYSKSHICRLIRTTTGCTFSDLVNHRKIALSCDLLETSETSAAEIAVECGFSSAEYFNRIFKKYTGMSPKAFRKNYRK